MTNKILAAGLLLLQSAVWAAPAPAEPKDSDGVVLSVMESTQLHFGKLFIGALSTNIGPYLDEKNVRRHGPVARLALSIEKNPSAHREVALAAGDSTEIAGYRLKVEHINPGNRGSAVLRLWAPPPKPVRKWPFSWFNFGEK